MTTLTGGRTPGVGEATPDFELFDSAGTRRRLSGMVAQGPLVLILYRGHW